LIQKERHAVPVPPTSDSERTLRGLALRVTRPRVAMLPAAHEHPHADTGSALTPAGSERAINFVAKRKRRRDAVVQPVGASALVVTTALVVEMWFPSKWNSPSKRGW
jgi:hypothetical protein